MSLQEFFSSTSQKKCVTINFNGEFDNGKGDIFLIFMIICDTLSYFVVALHLESEWTLHDFLNAASKRLGVASLNRIFNSDGKNVCPYVIL